MPDRKLMLIDGNSLLYRAFYALPLLHTREGIFTNGVYGFLTMFNRIIAQEEPTHIIVAFDTSRTTFRNTIYADYKANRSAPPDELKGQFQLLREVLTALNLDYIEKDGFEADDIIGTISSKAENEGIETLIVTGDNDVLQLVSDKVKVMLTKRGITETELFTPDKVKEKWEVDPPKMVEIKALMGDQSDNIPGIPGVGPKTAVKLVKQYGSLENLYDNCNEVKGKKLLERLIENKEKAFMSRKLAEIKRDIDLDIALADFMIKEPDYESVMRIYQHLEFNHFINVLKAKESEKRPLAKGNEKVGTAEGNEKGATAEDAVNEINVIPLDSKEAIQNFINEIKPSANIAMLFMTDYHHPMWAQLQGIYFEVLQKVYFIDTAEESGDKLQLLKPLLEGDIYKKYLHNAKFAQVLLKRHGIELNGICGDTLLLEYVNDPSFAGDDLSDGLREYLKIDIGKDQSALLVTKIRQFYSTLQSWLAPELRELLDDVERPVSNVLAAMEYNGVKVKRETLAEIAEELAVRIKQDEERIFELAGETFNINSPKQMGIVLFENMGLRVIKKTKTGYSTAAGVLEELYDDHEIIPHIIEYRQLSKLKSTYVDALQGLIHPETGRIHTIFKQAQTTTGRLSSVEPNLQNIPVKVEEGRRIRKAFTAESEEYLLMAADYSQIDLRSLAHISGDQNLIETFQKGIDIHARTAAEIFGVTLADVTTELRGRAKAVNFGIIYGISDFGLARDTGVSRNEARIYIDNYLDAYPGVRKYMTEIVEFGKKYGYVETILKRRRYLPDLNAKNKMLRSFAQRMALNTPIQGTSADIIKLAMIDVFAQLHSKQLKTKLLLQVHDELLLEVPKAEITAAAEILKNCMENAYELKVPLEVTLKTGPNWYDLQEYKI